MLLLLVPLIFNPLSFFIVRWLPALYLAAWPIIIQTLGRDALLLHAFVLILFTLTCDITRETMLKYIGFDLISLPAGVVLLAMLMSDKGASLLSLVLPVFGWAITIAEPIFLSLETFIIMEMIKSFNRWISRMSHQRDDTSHDLSSWEPPLTKAAIMARFIVILITIGCYIGTYMIVQESKSLLHDKLGLADIEIPIQFNYAIATLVTLQLIAFSATIYKESGILSETAMVSVTASVPIFIAAWSYYHLKTAATVSAGSSWTSYLPFSLFSGADTTATGPTTMSNNRAAAHLSLGGAQKQTIFFSSSDANDHYYYEPDLYNEPTTGDFVSDLKFSFRAFQRALGSSSPNDGFVKFALATMMRHLTVLINSILGLSMSQLVKYYFGPDFWYILAVRLACIFWWLYFSDSGGQQLSSSQSDQPEPDTRAQSGTSQPKRKWLASLNKSTLIKILIIAVYAQMLVQQMENKENLETNARILLDNTDSSLAQSCSMNGEHQAVGCAQVSSISAEQHTSGGGGGGGILDSTARWVACVWSSARSCSAPSSSSPSPSRAARILDALTSTLSSTANATASFLGYILQRVANLHTVAYSIYLLWLSKWRSSIIQRLMQSMLVQACYIGSLLLLDDEDNNDSYL